MLLSDPVAILDFETTGMSPDYGDRITEVGVAVVADGKIINTFQSLANAGVRIPSFIEQLTGISNAMIRRAPPVAEVMAALAEFVGKMPLVAHNASFDRKFLDAELARIGRQRQQEIA
ncbi:MAG: 3'-5' exonuclease, partial [Candidatus Competibacteraceae bacterium]|nr:3'-5' exonuclease [Candidatus Competibacteraceae bacterium]